MKGQSIRSNLSRRGFLATTASAAALTLAGAGCTKEEESKSMAKGGKIPVGLQVYSVRKEAEKDLPGVLAQVAQMGYQGVEFAGYYGHEAKDIRKMLDTNGLVCCGTHTQMADLADDKLAATLEFNKTLGNKYVIVPWLEPAKTNPRETWMGHAKRLNVLSEKLKPQGMWIGYHAHQHDFEDLGGTTPWDIIASNTRKDVIMQLDLGNCMDGGGDPVMYLRRYPGRAVTIHLKEHCATNPKAMIGEGDVKWAEVFKLIRTAGTTRWYIIEEEKDAVPPLQGAEVSLKNLKKLRT
jgi:sugar phosphate isomerase/epimerase